jgi:hypothetical protein
VPKEFAAVVFLVGIFGNPLAANFPPAVAANSLLQRQLETKSPTQFKTSDLKQVETWEEQ